MHSLSYSLSFKGKLYSLHSPAGANLQPIHSLDMSHLEPAPPLSWIRNSRARKTIPKTFSTALPSAWCFLDFLHLAHTLTITVMKWNCLSANSFKQELSYNLHSRQVTETKSQPAFIRHESQTVFP